MVADRSISRRKCHGCGRTGRIHCPAVGGFICSQCCGAGRGSKFECPSSCEHYPFGTDSYGSFGVIEGRLIKRCMDRLHADLEIDAWMKSELDRGFAQLKQQAPESLDSGGGEYLIQTVSVRAIYFETIVRGNTLARQWEALGWKGWNNDEQQLIEFTRRSLRPGVIEVVEVISEHQTLCRDPLDPDRGEFTVFDYSLAGRAAPYDLLFGWVMDLPQFSRTIGSCLVFERRELPALREKLRELEAEAGGPDELRSVLASKAIELWCWLYQTTKESRNRTIEGLDAHWCRAEFRFVGGADGSIDYLFSQIQFEQAEPDDSEEEDGEFLRMDWMRSGLDDRAPVMPLQTKKIGPGGEIAGEALAMLKFVENESCDGLILQCVGKKLFEYLLGRLEEMLGDSIVLEKRLEENLGGRSGTSGSRAKVQPNPADGEQTVALLLQDRYSEMLNERIPMLRNLTPLEAAASKDPEIQEELAEFARSHVNSLHELANRKGHAVPDLAWFFEKIGMGHIWR